MGWDAMLSTEVGRWNGEPEDPARRTVHWRHKLHESCDGKGLSNVPRVLSWKWPHRPVGHNWLTDGTVTTPSHHWLTMVALRAGTLLTNTRRARWKKADQSVHCPANCFQQNPRAFLPGQLRVLPYVGSLGHRLQVCPLTHGVRVLQHNRLFNSIKRTLEQKGYLVEVEPCFQLRFGLRKPDLVIVKPGPKTDSLLPEVWVLDITVVADNSPNLDIQHEAKVNYYSTVPEITERLMEQHSIPSSNVRFTAMTLNWRSINAPQSISDFLSLGGRKQDLEFLAKLCVSEGAKIYRFSENSTGRGRSQTRRV